MTTTMTEMKGPSVADTTAITTSNARAHNAARGSNANSHRAVEAASGSPPRCKAAQQHNGASSHDTTIELTSTASQIAPWVMNGAPGTRLSTTWSVTSTREPKRTASTVSGASRATR